MNRPLRLMIIACFVWQAVMNLAATGVHAGAYGDDGTSLMFLGEDTDVLTLATRREESAAKAPAVAQVLTRQDFWDRGDTTLANVLAYQPGFFMAPKEYGSRPYLRGIPESTLFLFNAVPLRSEASKGFHQIDQDLSLAGIKRIEIVRGAASVLWGLDAFSGVVNVVPLTGTDFQGLETGVLTTTDEDAQQAYINVGGNGPRWSGFGSLTLGTGGGKGDRATVVRFWDGPNGGPVPVTDRYGSDHPDSPNTLDVSGNMTLGKAFSVSGRTARPMSFPASIRTSRGSRSGARTSNTLRQTFKKRSRWTHPSRLPPIIFTWYRTRASSIETSARAKRRSMPRPCWKDP